MKVISSDLGDNWEKPPTLLLHGSVNGGADWLRFGHCKDAGSRGCGRRLDGSGQEAWHIRRGGQTLLYWLPRQ